MILTRFLLEGPISGTTTALSAWNLNVCRMQRAAAREEGTLYHSKNRTRTLRRMIAVSCWRCRFFGGSYPKLEPTHTPNDHHAPADCCFALLERPRSSGRRGKTVILFRSYLVREVRYSRFDLDDALSRRGKRKNISSISGRSQEKRDSKLAVQSRILTTLAGCVRASNSIKKLLASLEKYLGNRDA